MEHSIDLDACLDQPGAAHIARWLRTVPGVNEIVAIAGSRQVRILFDADLTSPQELSATAVRAGFPLRGAGKRAGDCCGACHKGGAQAG